jgi:pimeloyl-ACP methyl ester carboxylesterase
MSDRTKPTVLRWYDLCEKTWRLADWPFAQTKQNCTDQISKGDTMIYFKGVILIAALALAPAIGYADSLSGTQRYVEVRGVRLYTQIYGHGPPIVFLHGGMAFFDNSFAKQRDYFATYRTVVGIDQRGYGHSPDGPWSLSYQMMADDTAAVIDQLGLGSVDTVGHSDGANLALILARDHPKMVRHLVISGANIRVDLSPEEKQRAQRSPQQLAAHLRAVANSLPPWLLATTRRSVPTARTLDDLAGEDLRHVASARGHRTGRPQEDRNTGTRHGWRP